MTRTVSIKCYLCQEPRDTALRFCPACKVPLPIRHENNVVCPKCCTLLDEPMDSCPSCNLVFTKESYPSHKFSQNEIVFIQRRLNSINEMWIQDGPTKESFLKQLNLSNDTSLTTLYDIAFNTTMTSIKNENIEKAIYSSLVSLTIAKKLKHNPNILESAVVLAELHMNNDQYTSAIKILEDLLSYAKQDPNYEVLASLMLGQAHFLLGNYNPAKEWITHGFTLSIQHKFWTSSMLLLGNLALVSRAHHDSETFDTWVKTLLHHETNWKEKQEPFILFLLALSHYVWNNSDLSDTQIHFYLDALAHFLTNSLVNPTTLLTQLGLSLLKLFDFLALNNYTLTPYLNAITPRSFSFSIPQATELLKFFKELYYISLKTAEKAAVVEIKTIFQNVLQSLAEESIPLILEEVFEPDEQGTLTFLTSHT